MQARISILSLQLQIDSVSTLDRLSKAQNIASGCSDFITQCIMVRINHCTHWHHPFYSPKFSKIYRCWIVWGKNTCVVIIPSFLAITYIGQSIYLRLISRFQFIVFSCVASDRRLYEICR